MSIVYIGRIGRFEPWMSCLNGFVIWKYQRQNGFVISQAAQNDWKWQILQVLLITWNCQMSIDWNWWWNQRYSDPLSDPPIMDIWITWNGVSLNIQYFSVATVNFNCSLPLSTTHEEALCHLWRVLSLFESCLICLSLV